MLNVIGKKIFGTANERFIRSLRPIVTKINQLEDSFVKLTDEQLQSKTDEFRKRINDGESLDDLLPEAFATVREAAKRVLEQRHYDVQLMGGIILHRGMIAEMRTGEGKTLVSTLPTYLNALQGKGVHVVTVNDYLAKRDAEWMGKIHEFLGLSVGCITNDMREVARREAYASDVTYGTNNEFGFDYLRDNMKFSRDEMVQRSFNYAIIDEVDSILIDEARTPLIISGPVGDSTARYTQVDKYIPRLEEEDYEIDEKNRTAIFTDEGIAHLEAMLIEDGSISEDDNLYSLENMPLVHNADQALRAHKLFIAEKDYIVKDGKVIIIDEFTGRMMEGRRYSEGLHQAIEAKENVDIQNENQTLASITFQNYFRLYPKLSGMTGTAMTEASEFDDIYKLVAFEVPTHMPVQRVDDEDLIYRTAEDKYNAIINLVQKAVESKQPVLIGTTSIDKSELISRLLKKNKIKHSVLNARQHAQEAHIITQAGRPGAITVATNMAGRGTDIQLGGNADLMIAEAIDEITDAKEIAKITTKIQTQVEEDRELVKEAGGLCVIGSERHESRRIDNQLRGRSGRQGDPGYTRFFLSAEDDLIRIFGADKKMDWVMGTMGDPGEPISHPLITKLLEKSQKRVEAHNYDIRKNLLKFDDVMNEQRKAIFEQRVEVMESEDVSDSVKEMRDELIENLVATYIPAKAYQEQWDIDSLEKELFRIFGIHVPATSWAEEDGIAEEAILERTAQLITSTLDEKTAQYPTQLLRDVEKRLLLYTLDDLWKDHLYSLDYLRKGIGLRGIAQKDPLNEYKREAFEMFSAMLDNLKETYSSRLAHLELHDDGQEITVFDRRNIPTQESRVDPALAEQAKQNTHDAFIQRTNQSDQPFDKANPETWGKTGRNDPCPCESGKKYKHCHGKIT